MAKIYIYVVARDFGFAPNPFHGFCSLATCKPEIRNTAKINDWIFGVGGSRLKSTGKCIYAMKITQKISFNEYWSNPKYNDKKPVRNGSKKMIVGDNIYFFDETKNVWHQEHSHHSLPNGDTNVSNLKRDTSSSNVLLSTNFYYFGRESVTIPEEILMGIGYKNKIGHRVFEFDIAYKLVEWLEEKYLDNLNLVKGKPYDFENGQAHYSAGSNKISKK